MPRPKKTTKHALPDLPPLRRVDGARLRKARGDAELTQFTLSALSGVSVTAIARLERGSELANPSVGDLGRLADVLGVTLEWLAPKPK